MLYSLFGHTERKTSTDEAKKPDADAVLPVCMLNKTNICICIVNCQKTMMKPLKDEEAADGISRKKSQTPFIKLVQLWLAVRRWRRQCRPDECYSK